MCESKLAQLGITNGAVFAKHSNPVLITSRKCGNELSSPLGLSRGGCSEATRAHGHARAAGHRQRAALIGFKCDLLRQHDVARGQLAIRNEAPFAHVLARAAELLDVGLRAMVNSIPRAGVAADYVEVPESLVAPPLLRREPFL